jgi:hypothetical protein
VQRGCCHEDHDRRELPVHDHSEVTTDSSDAATRRASRVAHRSTLLQAQRP